MAIAHLNLASIANNLCSIDLLYDPVTLAVSAVQAVNSTPLDCWVQVQNSVTPSHVASGILAASTTAQFAVPAGALTLTLAVPPSGGTAQLSTVPWSLSTRYPA